MKYLFLVLLLVGCAKDDTPVIIPSVDTQISNMPTAVYNAGADTLTAPNGYTVNTVSAKCSKPMDGHDAWQFGASIHASYYGCPRTQSNVGTGTLGCGVIWLHTDDTWHSWCFAGQP